MTAKKHRGVCRDCGRSALRGELCGYCRYRAQIEVCRREHVGKAYHDDCPYCRQRLKSRKEHPCRGCGKTVSSWDHYCSACSPRHLRPRKCESCGCKIDGRLLFCGDCKKVLRWAARVRGNGIGDNCPAEFHKVVERRIRYYRKRAERGLPLFEGVRPLTNDPAGR